MDDPSGGIGSMEYFYLAEINHEANDVFFEFQMKSLALVVLLGLVGLARSDVLDSLLGREAELSIVSKTHRFDSHTMI